MAVGDESIGFGGTVQIDDGGSGAAPGAAFTILDHIVTLGIPAPKIGTAESKRLGLARIRKIATIEDGGEITIKVQFTNAQWARLETIRLAKQRNNWKFTVPDDNGNTVVTVVCLVTENKIDPLEPDKITDFEIMLTVAE